MDLVSRKLLIHFSQHGLESQSQSHSQSQAISPITSSSSSIFHPHMHHSSTSFPIIAIAIIGILATAFLLVSYYIFVIKCCLNWHRIDLLRRFSPSRRRQDPTTGYSPGTEPRGLEEAVIRLIPVIHFKSEDENTDSAECAVCLNDFQQDEKLRIIPNCNHVFHIDCIDVWLQNNANCPLCRTSISLTKGYHFDQMLQHSPFSVSTQDQNQHNDEDFVVIELSNNDAMELSLPLPLPLPLPRASSISLSPRKSRKKLHKVTSMGDECIDIRATKDEQFSVQPIRRSFSMDSSGDRQFYLAVQEALHQQKRQINEVNNSIEGCSGGGGGGGGGSGRVKKSFFLFGYGSRSRSSVQPVYLDS
ncbi:unnamed protein product [Lathyrus oleraceus]|uniref:RING-H2 finger protein ATL16 n=1 Tax=Pisum sativum TaxID=3888 RepID=UPI001FC47B97|nr:RING-H2 finger protein ATL16 [Pisum sativum]